MKPFLPTIPRLILSLAILAAFPAAAHAQWGYARVEPPGVVNPNFSRSSVNQSIKATMNKGVSEVTFLGLGSGPAPWGTVQVTAVTALRECKAERFSLDPPDFKATILCFTADGAPMDAAYSVLVLRSNISIDRQGYVLADQPKDPSYTPNATTSYNSAGGQIHIIRPAPGDYWVTFDGLGVGAEIGNVQVTAYGPDSNVCTFREWIPSSPNYTVRVQCSETTGIPADSAFTLLVETGDAAPPLKQAYTWDDQPMTTPYSPQPPYTNGAVEIFRLSPGTYQLNFQNLGSSVPAGNVQVTAQGTRGEFCNALEFSSSSQQRLVAVVRCYKALGAPVDLSYTVLIEQ